MKNNFLKYFVVLMCLTLAFSIISPSLAEASESQDSQINSSIPETTVDNEFDNNLNNESSDVNQDLLVDPSKGTKYVDGWSGERIAWDENGNGVAVLLRKGTDEIDTVYDEDHQKYFGKITMNNLLKVHLVTTTIHGIFTMDCYDLSDIF